MYFAEKIMHQMQIKDGQSKENVAEMVRKYGGDGELIRTTGRDGAGVKHFWIHDSVSDTPDMDASMYEYNERYIDVRTPLDDKRGLLTLSAIPFAIGSYVSVHSLLTSTLSIIFLGHYPDGEVCSLLDRILSVLVLPILVGIPLASLYLANRFLRLESLVQRRLLIRFNRINRKVYLHRPRYAGGLITLDWDKVTTAFDGKDAGSIGLPLVLMWYPQDTPNGLVEMVLVGRLARRNRELRDRWEFIRRFMQDGLQSLPPHPKTIGRFPWPWRSVQTILGLIWPLFSMASLRWAIPLVLLFSPGVLVFAFGNWLSLLLCWEPVFPRAIRRACGESWFSVLRTRAIDLGAWAMLAGLGWWLWPYWLQAFPP